MFIVFGNGNSFMPSAYKKPNFFGNKKILWFEIIRIIQPVKFLTTQS